jgi:hypothetical protein
MEASGMKITNVMSPEEVAALANDSAAIINAEFERLNEQFRSKYPIEDDIADPELRARILNKDYLGSDDYAQSLQNTMGRLIAREVMVVPVVPNSNPWDGREDLDHAVARFGLLIKDLSDRFPILLDENMQGALLFLKERAGELRTLLQSFVVLTSDPHGCRVLEGIEGELSNLTQWVQSASEVEVRKRLTATQESILAWSRQELKHLDSIAHAGNIRGRSH